MRYLFLSMLLLVCGCTKQIEEAPNVSMIHSYVIKEAENVCAADGGLHYIIPVFDIQTEDEHGNYPCKVIYKVRCNNQAIYTFTDAIAVCDIPIMQYDETIYNNETLHVKVRN